MAGGESVLNTSHIDVDLCAVEENVAVLREALVRPDGEPVKLCAVIKADAYGLGAVRIAHRLEKCGVDMFGVYTLNEAVELLAASVRTPVLVMSPVHSIADSDTLYRAVSHGRLHFSVHSLEQGKSLGKQADRFGVEIPIHVDVNTGMNRGAALPAEAAEVLEYAAGHRRLIVAGVSSHFSDAHSDDALTRKQAEAFAAWVAEMGELVPEKAVLHETNTFGMFRARSTHLGMARVGYAIAGYAGGVCGSGLLRTFESCIEAQAGGAVGDLDRARAVGGCGRARGVRRDMVGAAADAAGACAGGVRGWVPVFAFREGAGAP